MLMVKSSLFLLYYRIFSPIRRVKILIYCGIGFNVILYTTAFALHLHYCGPESGTDLGEVLVSRQCVVDAQNAGTAQASINIFSDLYLLCLPVPVVWKMQLPKKKKLGVLAMFMTGFLSVKNDATHVNLGKLNGRFSAVICGVLNLYYRALSIGRTDGTWTAAPVFITVLVPCFEFGYG